MIATNPENPLRRLDDWEHFVEDSEAVINHDLLANHAGERNPKDGKGRQDAQASHPRQRPQPGMDG